MSRVRLPAIFRSRIRRQSASALRIGQFSTFALKLRKNLYSLKCDILRPLVLPVSSMLPEVVGVSPRRSSLDMALSNEIRFTDTRIERATRSPNPTPFLLSQARACPASSSCRDPGASVCEIRLSTSIDLVR